MTPVLRRLLKRRDFLRVAAKGRKWATPGLVLQVSASPASRTLPPSGQGGDSRPGGTPRHPREAPQMDRDIPSPDNTIGVGFTASKKVGGAVARNRAKRRLRALAAEILPAEGRPGFDYVLIARPATVTRAFDDLRADLREALARTRGPRKGGGRRKAS